MKNLSRQRIPDASRRKTGMDNHAAPPSYGPAFNRAKDNEKTPSGGRESWHARKTGSHASRQSVNQHPNCAARKNPVMKSDKSSGFTNRSWLKSASGQLPENCTFRKKHVMNSDRSSGLTNPSLLKSAAQLGTQRTQDS